jgi:DNA-binding NarL/FixJ family response regulator
VKQDKIKVAVAEQNSLVRMGLRRLLGAAPDIQIIGETSDGQQLIQLIAQVEPDVLIVELELPIIDGIQIMEYLQKRESNTRILMISLEKDTRTASEIINRGAWGFFTRQEIPDKIIDAVRQAGRKDRQ